MFTLTLTEAQEPLQLVDTVTGEKESIPQPSFCHFQHNFRELPAAQIQAIIAIITKPPRQPRSDKGRPKKKQEPQLL